MFTKDGVKAVHGWAHECLDLLFAHAAKLPQPLFVQAVPGFGHASVRDQLAHLLASEQTWVRGLQHLAPKRWVYTDFPEVALLQEAKQQVVADTTKYVDGLSDAQLNTVLAEIPTNWAGPPRSPAFILHHVATHAFHHKGQVAAMFRMLGHPISDTDLQREVD